MSVGLHCFSFACFDFCWTHLFHFWKDFFSRISVVDSWLWFCVFEETSDVLHPKPKLVSFFGAFFPPFFQGFSRSDFLERPDLVCNHNSCSILGSFYFVELRTWEKNSELLKRIFFLFLFWILCFFWNFEICSDFALVISPLKSLFSQG